jgi:multiple sugar transport system substrate-binding protein
VAAVGALIVAACWPVLQLPFAGPDVTKRLVDCSESSTKNTFLAHIELHNHTGDPRSVALTDHVGDDLAPNGAGGYAAVTLNPYETRVVPYEFADDSTACASYTGDVVAAAGTARGANYSPPAQSAAPLPAAIQTPSPSAPTSAAPDPNSLYLAITNKEEQAPAKTFWDTAVAEFQAANPGATVHVSFDTPSNLAMESTVYPGSVARPDAVDLVLGADPATPAASNASTSYYAAGAILPGSVTADLLPVFDYQERGSGPGGAAVQYGIPFSGSTYALYYNKRLFARAHIAGPPATWSGLAADAAKVKALGVDGYGLKAPLGGDAAVLQLWMSGNGGDFMDAAKKTWTLNSPANVTTFRWLADDLMKPGLTTSPGFSADPGEQFAADALGMTVAGPDLIKKTEAGALGSAFGVAPVPGRTGPLTSPTGSVDDLLATKAHPERKALIAKFVAFLLSSKNQKRFADIAGAVPVTRSGTAAEVGNPLLKPFLDGMAKADWLPTRAPSWQVVQEDLYQRFFGLPGQDAQTVLDQLQAEIPVQP